MKKPAVTDKGNRQLPWPYDNDSSEEAKFNELLEKRKINADNLLLLLQMPDGKGFESYGYLDALRNLMALEFKIDGFRFAYASAMGLVKLPTRVENIAKNRRKNGSKLA